MARSRTTPLQRHAASSFKRVTYLVAALLCWALGAGIVLGTSALHAAHFPRSFLAGSARTASSSSQSEYVAAKASRRDALFLAAGVVAGQMVGSDEVHAFSRMDGTELMLEQVRKDTMAPGWDVQTTQTGGIQPWLPPNQQAVDEAKRLIAAQLKRDAETDTSKMTLNERRKFERVARHRRLIASIPVDEGGSMLMWGGPLAAP